MPTDADIAWAAGLFEGEGCWRLSASRKDGRISGGRRYVYAQLASTDEDVVQRFRAIVGVGSIYFRKAQRSGHKNLWTWMISDRDGFEHVAELFRPWLGERRLERLNEVLAAGHKVHECRCDFCGRKYLPQRLSGYYDRPFYCSPKCRGRDRTFVRVSLGDLEGRTHG